jgi:hypothetical protein
MPPGAPARAAHVSVQRGVAKRITLYISEPVPPQGAYTVSEARSGWPARAMRTVQLQHPTGAGSKVDGSSWQTWRPERRWAVRLPSYSMASEFEHRGMLPTAVVPLGFAIDTALFGGIIFLLWCAPPLARESLRRRRGACPACGYDLRGITSGTCPECGA